MMREASAALKPTGRTAPARSALTEDVPRLTLPDHALDPVDELDRLALEQGEQRPLSALVHRVPARRQVDVRRGPGAARARPGRELLRPGRVRSPQRSPRPGQHSPRSL